MFGQKNYPDPHQEIVDRFLEEHTPYESSKPLCFDLRKYSQYIREHNITDPTAIPDEVLDQFVIDEGIQAAAR